MAALPWETLCDLAHYRKIREIVSEYNSDYFGNKSKEEYFDMILETFPKEKDFVTFMEERGFE